jgi:tetratricopeptide (TPR) repeat protein
MSWPGLAKGLALGEHGKYDEAIMAHNNAIRINPKFAVAWINKGITLKNQGKYDEAIIAFNEAIRLDPNYANALYIKGPILGNRENMTRLL